MNYWQDSPRFWGNKTDDNPIYTEQGRELGDFINAQIERFGAYNVLDVGGYTGRMKQYITPKVTYFNYDIVNGVDITKPWDQPGQERMKYDFCFTSLTILCFPPEQAQFIVDEMKRHAIKGIILYEENWYGTPGFEHGRQLSEEYGGKWQYNWMRLLHASGGNVTRFQSEVNKNWSIYTQFHI